MNLTSIISNVNIILMIALLIAAARYLIIGKRKLDRVPLIKGSGCVAIALVIGVSSAAISLVRLNRIIDESMIKIAQTENVNDKLTD